MKRYTIELRRYEGPEYHNTFERCGTVKHRIYAEQVGNFCPIFCRYLGKWYLVKSDEGDTSDPFRAEPSYAKSFYINISAPCSRTTVNGSTGSEK